MPWNDNNIFELLPLLKTKVLLAHIRATSSILYGEMKHRIPVNIQNCHPFKYKNYLLCHNGMFESYLCGQNRKKIIQEIDNNLILNIKGTTDTEHFFYLILTELKKENCMIKAVKNSIKFIMSLGDNLVASFNICITDGKESIITRFISSNLHPPTLYISESYENNNFVISSEMLNENKDQWKLIDKNVILHIKNNKINIHNICD